VNDGGVGVADHLDHYDTAALAAAATPAAPPSQGQLSQTSFRCDGATSILRLFTYYHRYQGFRRTGKMGQTKHWQKKKKSATNVTKCFDEQVQA
jgi:hypothetical protein